MSQSQDEIRQHQGASDAYTASENPSTHKQKKRARVENPFVDIEAEVSGDNSRSEDDDEQLQDFLDDTEVQQSHSVSRRRLREEIEENEQFIAELIRKYVDKDTGSPYRDPEDGERHPRADDYPLWELFVEPGQESVIVFRILRRSLEGMSGSYTPIRSAFSRPGLHGVVVIEAQTKSDIEHLCEGMGGIRLSKLSITSHNNGIAYLESPALVWTPKVDSWIRLKRSPYRNDIAFILAVDPRDFRINVVLVPRLHLSPKSNKRKRKALIKGPLDPEEVKQKSGAASLTIEYAGESIKGYRFNGSYFDASGFLILEDLPHSSYHPSPALPSLQEITTFRRCTSIDQHHLNLAQQLHESRSFHEGDQVKVFIGEVEGLTGFIKRLEGSTATLQLSCDDSCVEVPTTSIRRYFIVGDRVRVKSGVEEGKVGWVVDVNDKDYTIVLYIHRPEPRSFIESIHLLEFADDGFRAGHFIGTDDGESSKAPQLRMHNRKYDRLIRRRVKIIKGNFKPREGVVISVNNHAVAKVELAGLLVHGNGLVDVPVDHLVFEQSNRPGWFAFKDYQDKFTFDLQQDIPYAPIVASAPQTLPEGGQTPMPVPDDSLESPWIPSPEDSNGIPSDFWLLKLQPKLRDHESLLVRISSSGTFSDGILAGAVGVFQKIQDTTILVEVQIPRIPFPLTLSFHYKDISPMPATALYQTVFVLEDGIHHGTRYFVNRLDNGVAYMGPMNGNAWKYKEKKALPVDQLCVYK